LSHISENKQFSAGVDSALELLHRVDMGTVPDVSEVHAASTFRVQGSMINTGSFDP
jgi:hypothetical protein